MSERFYRPELDALRFFAFACVFCHHITIPFVLRQAAAFGVCIFFLLSAYLIVSLLLREMDSTGTVNNRSFALRRILRIWPLYFSVLAFCFILGRFAPTVRISGLALSAFTLLAGNIYEGHFGWIAGPVSPLWSLSVEEQFYLVIPTLARFGGKRALYAVSSLTICVSYIAIACLAARGANPDREMWASSFVQFQFFGAGAVIALLQHHRAARLSFASRIFMLIAGFILWFAAVKFGGVNTPQIFSMLRILAGYAIVLVGTVFIFLAFLHAPVVIPKSLVYLGKISYGLYLFHMFWIWLLTEQGRMPVLRSHPYRGYVLAFALTIMSASLSYHFFERPILKFKQRFETIRTRPA